MSTLGPIGVFLLMVLEGVGLPFPSEVIMVFAGFLSTGNIGLFVIYALAGSVGGFIGNLILYYIAVYGGRPLILFIGKYFGMKEEHLVRTEKWFDARGEWTVFFGRFVPGFRSYMSIPAGVSKMNVIKFSIFTFTGSLIWSTALEAGGYVLGKSWDTLVPIIEKIGIILLAIFTGAFIIYFIYRWYLKKKNSEPEAP
ncbi:MAG: DedA family protein [Thermoplasmatales archaeon]|nr:DedA family protein [Candidatus Thermoplasmatota archaeon]MDA8055032.1 DedA family protein [Thermoplasmatales archaeon]